MTTLQILILYGFIAVIYSKFPASVRPTTWLGWIVFLTVMLFATSIFAIPVSVLMCWIWTNYAPYDSYR